MDEENKQEQIDETDEVEVETSQETEPNAAEELEVTEDDKQVAANAARVLNEVADADVSDEGMFEGSRVEEYFQIKKTLRLLRRDLREHTEDHDNYDEMKELNEKVKKLREKIKDEESIRALKEKIDTLKERQDLIKEIIKVELMETGQPEVKAEGRKLKLIEVLKDIKDEEEQV